MATEELLINTATFGKVNGRTVKLMDSTEIIGKMDSIQLVYTMKIHSFRVKSKTFKNNKLEQEYPQKECLVF